MFICATLLFNQELAMFSLRQIYRLVCAVLFFSIMFFSSLSCADLIVGASSSEVITDIVLAPWGTESFAISTTRSQTNCAATNGWVIFAESNQSSQEAYDRAYALALSAMSSNQPVFVDSSSGTDCTMAYMLGVGAIIN
jgi:hypothetical protein